MPTITVSQKVLTDLLSMHGLQHDPESLQDELPLLGTDIDVCNADELVVEIFPDRPDLLSAETLSHSRDLYLHKSFTGPSLDVSEGDIEFVVDEEISEIRPIILAASVTGVITGETQDEIDEFIKGLMDHQEKVAFCIG